MTETSFTDQELLSYLDESLSTGLMSQIEAALRDSDRLRVRLAELARQRDEGVHSIGEIWRRNRLSCPTRSQLGGYLLETLSSEFQSFIKFHLEKTGCRFCKANLEDLKAGLSNLSADSQRRREKYFQSSAGYLSSKQDEE